MTDEANAVGAIATTAGKAIDALKGLGGYAAQVFGDIPHDLAQWALGDRLKARRTKNMQDLGLLAAPLLSGIDPERLSEPSPSVMIPLIAASADEERAELQDLWARLLANAAVDGGRKVRRSFFETVKQMEPIDAAVLQAYNLAPPGPQGGHARDKNAVATLLNTRLKKEIAALDLDVSSEAQIHLRCLQSGNFGNYLTPYGTSLILALEVI